MAAVSERGTSKHLVIGRRKLGDTRCQRKGKGSQRVKGHSTGWKETGNNDTVTLREEPTGNRAHHGKYKERTF